MIELALPALYTIAGILFVLEHVFPAHRQKTSPSWYLRGLLINTMQLGVFLGFDRLWSVYAQNASLLDLGAGLSTLAGALLAYFIFTFVVYWWHRLRHHSDFIWRLFHQLHHSPQRIQTLTAYYIHPLDMIANLLISNTIMFIILGLNAEGAAWYTLITGTAGFLIHANIRIPRAVGYVFQTPEMHRLHHKSGHHAHNYSDIVIWDWLFGTYCNPETPVEHCGFSREQEERLLPMFLGHDVIGNDAQAWQ